MCTPGKNSRLMLPLLEELAQKTDEIERLQDALRKILTYDERTMYERCPDCDYSECANTKRCKETPRSECGKLAAEALTPNA